MGNKPRQWYRFCYEQAELFVSHARKGEFNPDSYARDLCEQIVRKRHYYAPLVYRS